jgi:hypothetical protein
MRTTTQIIAFALLASAASAGIIEVESFHLGGFYGPDEMGMPSGTPDNDMSFQNYFMGRTTVEGFTTEERRTFFAFDLSGAFAAIPEGETIVSVSFEFELLFGGVIANFTDGMAEHVTFSSTEMPYEAIADPTMFGVSPEEVWETLGTGTEYAGFDIEPAGTPPGMYGVDLAPEALMDMEIAASMDEAFVISGKLDTYDPDMAALFEFVFGLSDVVVDSTPTGMPVPKLVITTAPIPTPSGLAILSIAGLMTTRRRR